MLKKLFKLFEPSTVVSQTISEQDHGIDSRDISHGSYKTIEQLQRAGFEAYLVGGGVRDLLLDADPKDFDVATSATPEQVKRVFRNSRIIGKRFRIVHVRFGREIVEVTTFRGSHNDARSSRDANQSDAGVLLRDNVYGDIESDALRRDFTINALYYNPINGEVLDFCGGLKDLKSRVIRIIGDPEDRYKEDPVRLLRAARFAGKLGFNIDPVTEKPIREHADYLSHIPSARLFEEVLKLFMSGQATATLNKLREYNLLKYLFPATDYCLNNGTDFDRTLVEQATINTDKRIRQGKRITPAFIYAAFLWSPLQAAMRPLIQDQKMSPQEAMLQASQGIISQQLACTAIPKRFLIPMRDIWQLQLRLPRRDRGKAFATLEHQRFRAGYDFLLLREQAGENVEGLGDWWTKFQFAPEEEREAMIAQVAPPRRRNPRKRRSKKPAQS